MSRFASQGALRGFAGCPVCRCHSAHPKLSTIELPSTLSDVRLHAFDGCSATNVTLAAVAKAFSLKKGVLVNEEKHQVVHAFVSVDSTYTVPTGVTSIGSYAFAGNTAIKKVTVGRDCKTIGSHAFYKCSKRKTAVLGSKVRAVKDSAFALKAKSGAKRSPLRSVTVPKSVKSIGSSALGCYLDSKGRCKADKTFTVKCKKSSAAAKYAKKQGMKVKYV